MIIYFSSSYWVFMKIVKLILSTKISTIEY